MMQDKLIEGAVNSYNMSIAKLFKALSEKDADKVTVLYESLEVHRNTIKRLFLDSPSLEITSPEVSKTIADIREDKDIFAMLSELEQNTIDDYYYSDDYLTQLNAEYDLTYFLPRRIQAGALITSRKMPKSIVSLFEKIRECYMFGLYEATIIFCRAIMEESLEEYYFSRNKNIKRSYQASRTLDSLLNDTNFPECLAELKNDLNDLRKHANDLLHSPFRHYKEEQERTIHINDGHGSFHVTYKNDHTMEEKALAAIRTITRAIEALFAK